MNKELIFLNPVLKECVWGGQRLVTEYPYSSDSKTVGECWAVSAHPHGDCIIMNGGFQGKTLSELYKEQRELFGNIEEEEFPLLVKIIDAKSDLSIQVHPDDKYAREVEKVPFGKTECWYILDCPEDAELVIGHHAKSREELADWIHQDKYEDLIRRIPVKKGDMIQIDPGTIHAICGGFLILETQQNSDITYRVYDYHRLVDGKPRQLHVEQSIEVVNVPDESYKTAIRKAAPIPQNTPVMLTESDYYKVWKLETEGECELSLEEKFVIVSVLEGSGTVDDIPVSKGAHFVIPYEYGKMICKGNMMMILSAPVCKQ